MSADNATNDKYNAPKKAASNSDKQNTLKLVSTDTAPGQAANSKYFASTRARQQQLTNAITNLVTDATLPLQLVDTPGFKAFMNVVEPRYAVLSRRTITRRLLNFADGSKQRLGAELEETVAAGNSVHCTMNLWSSCAMEPAHSRYRNALVILIQIIS